MTSRRWPAYLLLGFVLLLLLWAAYSMQQPLKNYQIQKPPKQVSQETLDKIVQPFLKSTFWEVDLHLLHAHLLRLDWVESVTVKRHWPNALSIQIKEQTPVVRWGEDAFLNQKGQVFYPNDMENQVPDYDRFVMLNGEDVQSVTLLESFVDLQSLLDEHRWQVKRLHALADGVWKIEFFSGINMLIPSEDWQGKLTRFFTALPKVSKKLRKFAQVYDLRYSNGFVIQKPEDLETPDNNGVLPAGKLDKDQSNSTQ